MVQRRAARWAMNNFSTTESVTYMLDQLGWETLEHRRSSFRQIPNSKDFYKYSFFPLAVIQWNLLPQHVVELVQPIAFKASVANI